MLKSSPMPEIPEYQGTVRQDLIQDAKDGNTFNDRLNGTTDEFLRKDMAATASYLEGKGHYFYAHHLKSSLKRNSRI